MSASPGTAIGKVSSASELRLNSIKDSAKQIIENPVFPIARMECENPLCSLFAIYVHLPKLNVAGSIPVSRSIKSMFYEETPKTLLHSCSNYMRKRLFSS